MFFKVVPQAGTKNSKHNPVEGILDSNCKSYHSTSIPSTELHGNFLSEPQNLETECAPKSQGLLNQLELSHCQLVDTRELKCYCCELCWYADRCTYCTHWFFGTVEANIYLLHFNKKILFNEFSENFIQYILSYSFPTSSQICPPPPSLPIQLYIFLKN